MGLPPEGCGVGRGIGRASGREGRTTVGAKPPPTLVGARVCPLGPTPVPSTVVAAAPLPAVRAVAGEAVPGRPRPRPVPRSIVPPSSPGTRVDPWASVMGMGGEVGASRSTRASRACCAVAEVAWVFKNSRRAMANSMAV